MPVLCGLNGEFVVKWLLKLGTGTVRVVDTGMCRPTELKVPSTS